MVGAVLPGYGLGPEAELVEVELAVQLAEQIVVDIMRRQQHGWSAIRKGGLVFVRNDGRCAEQGRASVDLDETHHRVFARVDPCSDR